MYISGIDSRQVSSFLLLLLNIDNACLLAPEVLVKVLLKSRLGLAVDIDPKLILQIDGPSIFI